MRAPTQRDIAVLKVVGDARSITRRELARRLGVSDWRAHVLARRCRALGLVQWSWAPWRPYSLTAAGLVEYRRLREGS